MVWYASGIKIVVHKNSKRNIKEGKKERKAVLQNKGQTDTFTIIIELPGHSKDYIIHTS